MLESSTTLTPVGCMVAVLWTGLEARLFGGKVLLRLGQAVQTGLVECPLDTRACIVIAPQTRVVILQYTIQTVQLEDADLFAFVFS